MEEIPTPTPRELEILKILWVQGPGSVRGVHRSLLADDPGLAYNTVQTMLRIMEGKGLVRHELSGRTFIYTAEFTRDENTARFLDRVFDGAASQLVSSLLRSERVSAEELERMQATIAAARRKKGRWSAAGGHVMSGTSAGEWLLRTLLGGGGLLLLAWLGTVRLAAPARRQRLSEWAMAASLG